MKLYAITDNPTTRIGLELAEITTLLIRTRTELRQAMESIPQGEVLIIITENLASSNAGFLKEYRAKNPKTLITIIPEPYGI